MAAEFPNHKLSMTRLSWACLVFFVVYVGIHFILNVTAQGTAPPPSFCALLEQYASIIFSKKMMVNLAGPITISICSSLLLFSFGTFLIHGIEHISVSEPSAFIRAFMIFIYGQVAVQITGHMEIYILNSSSDLSGIPWYGYLAVAPSYPIAFFFLFLLENYSARVFSALKHQLPASELPHASNARHFALITVISIAILVLKPLVLLVSGTESKFGVTLVTLLLELALVVYVVGRAAAQSHRKAAA
ncbi:hypothetical protein EEB18_000220 [Sphingopyxis sp. OPL5]|uniref:hypothetical protein n=1 Tax=Sphingopyxis sp. OPL5 TaxID=2486273 RepID=UPI00164DF432|nr:hypothetical protein [Sphingopyxis sp. OPL5]QNO27470.1 hypothetical protein EEB18_000220 [Sphingopyxis sp. OPL5]